MLATRLLAYPAHLDFKGLAIFIVYPVQDLGNLHDSLPATEFACKRQRKYFMRPTAETQKNKAGADGL